MLPINLRRGGGSFFTESGGRDNLLTLGEDRLLVDVDHLQLVATFQVLFTDLLDVEDCVCRPGRDAGDVKAKDILLIRGALEGLLENLDPGSEIFSSCLSPLGLNCRSKVETDEHPLGIGEISYDLSDRLGEFPHERRDGDDLIALGKLRVFEQVDDFYVVASLQVLLADFLEVGEGGKRFWRLTCNIKLQLH